MKIFKKLLNKKEKEKVELDLNFIKTFLYFSKKKGFRVVVSGGYGLDGILGEITRFHNDLDLIVYWKKNRKEAVSSLKNIIKKKLSSVLVKVKDGKFYTTIDFENKEISGAVYVIETFENAFKNINKIKLLNGKIKINSMQQFPTPVKASLLGLKLEAQNPNVHLADILYKRKKEKKLKHKQDIENFRFITDREKVGFILSQY